MLLSLKLGFFCVVGLLSLVESSKVCYHAKTCIHNGFEKCGVMKEGDKQKYRRFFDACDIKEYNCLRDTNYVKTALKNCNDLPPLPPIVPSSGKPVGDAKVTTKDDKRKRKRKPDYKKMVPVKVPTGKLLVTNSWWCWLAENCFKPHVRVCGWDGRFFEKRPFDNECSLAEFNCGNFRDFRVVPDNKCNIIPRRLTEPPTTRRTPRGGPKNTPWSMRHFY